MSITPRMQWYPPVCTAIFAIDALLTLRSLSLVFDRVYLIHIA
jgi:hypothetical protein